MICSYEPCDRNVHARNYCAAHLSRFKRGLSLEGKIQERSKRISDICSFDGCEREFAAKGFCNFHLVRFLKGTPLDAPKKKTKYDRVGKVCPTCKNVFTVKFSEARIIHCSKACVRGKWGEDNHNWKGGTTSTNLLERGRFAREVRTKVFERDNYTCQICFVPASGKLQVDHIERWSEHPELRFEMDNCRTLCMACHYYVTFKRKIPEGVVWGKPQRKVKSLT